jgi:anti-sigma factor RsiW
MDERLEELLWLEIEGGLSADERKLLEQRLADDAAARSARTRLAALNEQLSGMGSVEPPAELRSRIHRALGSHESRASESFVGRLRAAFDAFPVGRARFAYLVAGIFTGVVISLLLSDGFDATTPVDRGALYGAAAVGGQEWLELELPDEAGVVRLRREGGELTAVLSSRRALVLTLDRAGDGSVALEVMSEDGPVLERTIDWSEIPGS